MASSDRPVLRDQFTETQLELLAYLRERAQERTYFKSWRIAEETDLSAKEVGTNLQKLQGATDVDIEQWSHSSSTTWKVTL